MLLSKPPFCPIYSVHPQAGRLGGRDGAKGRFLSQAGGEGELPPALLFARPGLTVVPPLCKCGKPTAPGYFPGVNLSSSSFSRSRKSGQFSVSAVRAPREQLGKGSSRDSGQPVFPLPGDRTKGHPLSRPVTVRIVPSVEPGSREEEPR